MQAKLETSNVFSFNEKSFVNIRLRNKTYWFYKLITVYTIIKTVNIFTFVKSLSNCVCIERGFVNEIHPPFSNPLCFTKARSFEKKCEPGKILCLKCKSTLKNFTFFFKNGKCHKNDINRETFPFFFQWKFQVSGGQTMSCKNFKTSFFCDCGCQCLSTISIEGDMIKIGLKLLSGKCVKSIRKNSIVVNDITMRAESLEIFLKT